MPKKNLLQKIYHNLFSLLPNYFLCIFGSCRGACASLAMEDEIDNVQSTKLKLHLSICRKCWNYYQQMKIVNKGVQKGLKAELTKTPSPKVTKESIESLANRFSK